MCSRGRTCTASDTCACTCACTCTCACHVHVHVNMQSSEVRVARGFRVRVLYALTPYYGFTHYHYPDVHRGPALAIAAIKQDRI